MCPHSRSGPTAHRSPIARDLLGVHRPKDGRPVGTWLSVLPSPRMPPPPTWDSHGGLRPHPVLPSASLQKGPRVCCMPCVGDDTDNSSSADRSSIGVSNPLCCTRCPVRAKIRKIQRRNVTAVSGSHADFRISDPI
uniref:Uncharacterized protein n=1 Tax=Myotis myotis TaxID=51298 RepID=A0A7J7WVT1_MYOMY|nr:hypothetical protein mMyoMyo1_011873 [Myotis myotis]